jgi:hypothetical protein
MNTIRELTTDDLDHVAGGGGTDCYCGCPTPTPTAGNPGNRMAVGGAGETPGQGTGFNETAPGGNGLQGRSTTD